MYEEDLLRRTKQRSTPQTEFEASNISIIMTEQADQLTNFFETYLGGRSQTRNLLSPILKVDLLITYIGVNLGTD